MAGTCKVSTISERGKSGISGSRRDLEYCAAPRGLLRGSAGEFVAPDHVDAKLHVNVHARVLGFVIDDGLLRTYNCLRNGHRLSIKIDPCRQLTERRVRPASRDRPKAINRDLKVSVNLIDQLIQLNPRYARNTHPRHSSTSSRRHRSSVRKSRRNEFSICR